MDPETKPSSLLPLSVLGMGFGLSMIPANTAAVRALPGDGVGVASGILGMLRQMGVVFGVAVLVAFLSMQIPT